MKTTHYYISFGVNEGFSKKNTEANKLEVAEKIKEFIDVIEKETKIYVSGLLIKNTAVYKNEWSCPYGGEVTFTYMGNRNKYFCKSDRKYRKAVIKLAKMIKQEYGQKEVFVSFTKSHLVYIDK